MRIYIIDSKNKRMDLNVGKYDTIRNVMIKIKEKAEIPQEIVLHFDGEILEENKTLDDYGISENSQIIFIGEFRNINEDKIKEENREEIELRKQLNNEKEKNEKLTKKINQLENELKNEKNKNKILEEKSNLLVTELENLKKNYKNIDNKSKIKEILNDNIDSKESLYKTILEKDAKIKELEIKLKRYPFELNEGEKLMSINFKSFDQKIQNFSIICKNTDEFNKIERRLYDEYKEYYDTENYFTVNGIKIHKIKTLEENKIHNNDVIILNVLDI